MDNKRTYIRRKRCLNEIFSAIKNTLAYISSQNGQDISVSEMNDIAKKHSHAIEAACWFPKQHITESEYQSLLMGKTKLLCQALISSNIPGNKNIIHDISPPIQSDPETIERAPNETKFISSTPMTPTEYYNFLKQGTFTLGSLTANSLPPLLDKSTIYKI